MTYKKCRLKMEDPVSRWGRFLAEPKKRLSHGVEATRPKGPIRPLNATSGRVRKLRDRPGDTPLPPLAAGRSAGGSGRVLQHETAEDLTEPAGQRTWVASQFYFQAGTQASLDFMVGGEQQKRSE